MDDISYRAVFQGNLRRLGATTARGLEGPAAPAGPATGGFNSRRRPAGGRTSATGS
jgi:hypothetical protein